MYLSSKLPVVNGMPLTDCEYCSLVCTGLCQHSCKSLCEDDCRGRLA
ncbi:MAG: hypothetical protein K6T75_04020 [Acetobacteraceae bacterium]|nr:hypothetical protein [Acetobacteraceae bacterium]